MTTSICVLETFGHMPSGKGGKPTDVNIVRDEKYTNQQLFLFPANHFKQEEIVRAQTRREFMGNQRNGCQHKNCFLE